MNFTKPDVKNAMTLYAVTDRRWLKEGQRLEEVCQALAENGITFLQLREKELEDDAFDREAAALQALCRRCGIPFVVNDRVESALRIGADGVHVGQSDIRGRDIRAMLGPDRILGISAGSVAEAVAAEKAGADYIGVGAVFPTDVKENARVMDMALFRSICAAVSIPVVAIGGISEGNLSQLAGCGANGVAVVSALFAAEDPGAAAARLRRRCDDMLKGGSL